MARIVKSSAVGLGAMRLVAILLAAAFVMSGCAASQPETTSTSTPPGKDPANPSGTTTSRAPTSTGPTTSPSSGSSANEAPVPRLSASALGGPAPFQVNFTLDATDADGDALSWTLAFGDGSSTATGSTTPATVAHNFTAMGNYTVTLTVSDGTASARALLNLTVTEAASQDETANYTGHPGECFLTVLGDLEGISHVRIEILAATHGAPFVAKWTTTSPPAWVEIGFWNDDGLLYRYGGWGNDLGTPPAASPGQVEQTGTVVPDSTYATLRACDGGPGSITYHAG